MALQGPTRFGPVGPVSEVRTWQAMRLRLERAREARAQGIPWPAAFVDTLVLKASPARMTTRCLEMNAVLRHCGRSDDTVAGLISEVSSEAEELRGFRHGDATRVCGPLGGLLGGAGGFVIGWNLGPSAGESALEGCLSLFTTSLYGLAGLGVGLVSGSLVGLAVGQGLRESRIASHRARVNDLVLRVNRAVANQP